MKVAVLCEFSGSLQWPLGLHLWAGCCDEACDLYLAEHPGCGAIRHGGWAGPPKHSQWGWSGKNKWLRTSAGLPFHVWIECPDGSIIDPTRWVFEGVWPYIYRGSNDYYVLDTAKERDGDDA